MIPGTRKDAEINWLDTPWGIEADMLAKETGWSLEKCWDLVVLAWLEKGDARPLAACLTFREITNPNILKYFAAMLEASGATDYRVVIKRRSGKKGPRVKPKTGAFDGDVDQLRDPRVLAQQSSSAAEVILQNLEVGDIALLIDYLKIGGRPPKQLRRYLAAMLLSTDEITGNVPYQLVAKRRNGAAGRRANPELDVIHRLIDVNHQRLRSDGLTRKEAVEQLVAMAEPIGKAPLRRDGKQPRIEWVRKALRLQANRRRGIAVP
jgi:hypothetical protein